MRGVSIAISSSGRPEYLQRAVACALAQRGVDFEVVVVEQGGVPTPLPSEVRYYWLAEPHVGRARNLSWQVSRGELILFVDDDTEFRPSLAQAHWNRYLREPQLGALAGLVIPRDWQCRDEVLAFWRRQFPGDHYHWMPTGNLSIPRRVLGELGGFDPLLSHACEDSELTLRITLRGYRLKMCASSEMELLHHEALDGGCGFRTRLGGKRLQRVLWCKLYAYLKNREAFALSRYLESTAREWRRFLRGLPLWKRPLQGLRFGLIYWSAFRAARAVRKNYRPEGRVCGPAYAFGPPYR